MSKSALITIIIPVYKNEFYLKKSLKSCLDQTYKNLEIIVITDGTPNQNFVQKLVNSHNDKRIILIKNLINKGVAAVLNQAIIYSKGTYICWLSHDDYYHEEKIRLQYENLLKSKKSISYTNFIQKNRNKYKYINSINLEKYENQYVGLLMKDNIHGCSLMIASNLFQKENLKFNTNLKHVQDYELWLKIIKKYKFSYLNKYLLFSNIHNLQNSKLYNNEAQFEKKDFWSKIFLELQKMKITKIKYLFITFSLSKRNYLYLSSLQKISNNRFNLIIFLIFFIFGYLTNICISKIKK